MSPTQRSVTHLKALGYRARVIEKWNPFAKIRQDLFGGDILALKPGEPVLIIQATSGSNHAGRRTKLEEQGFTALWVGQGPRGKRKAWLVRL